MPFVIRFMQWRYQIQFIWRIEMYGPASTRSFLEVTSAMLVRLVMLSILSLRFQFALSGLLAASSANAEPTASAHQEAAVHVQSATYGENCGAPIGNATNDVQMTCGGDRECTYMVDVERLGDPAPSCAKGFKVEYQCSPGGPSLKALVPGEAGVGKWVELSCRSATENEVPAPAKWDGVRVMSATYGGNCGAQIGNATADVASSCGTAASCNYKVDVNKLGDPAAGCNKGFFVKYQCGGQSASRTAAIHGEAGLGSVVHLSCH